ncbi:MAG: acyloxyacyl hydrolase [Flavobacteriales bacterium]
MKAEIIDIKLIILALFLCVATPNLTHSQEDYKLAEESLSNHIVSGSINRGFLIPHHNLMHYYLEDKTTSFTLSIEKELKGGWTSEYNFISKGIEVSRSSLSNDEILGFSTHLVGYANCALHSNGKGRLKFGAGVAVLSQKFDLDKNVKNLAIGSTINGAVILEYSYRIPIRESLSVNPHLRFVHYSNGGYRLPNLGLNLPSIGLSIEKQLSNLSLIADVRTEQTSGKRLVLGLSLGRHELISAESGQFFNSNLSLQYLNSSPKKMIWGGGLDIHYSAAYENYAKLNFIEYESENSFTKSLRTGLHGAFGLKLGVSEIHANVGFYLIDQLELDGPVYQRIYFLTRVTDYLNFRIGLKAHMGAAETFELGLTTKLWSK